MAMDGANKHIERSLSSLNQIRCILFTKNDTCTYLSIHVHQLHDSISFFFLGGGGPFQYFIYMYQCLIVDNEFELN